MKDSTQKLFWMSQQKRRDSSIVQMKQQRIKAAAPLHPCLHIDINLRESKLFLRYSRDAVRFITGALQTNAIISQCAVPTLLDSTDSQ